MRIAYLDCFSGISGDMFLGALVAAGVPLELLHETVAALDLGARLEASPVMRSGISSTKVDVIVNGEKDLPREVYQEQKGKHLLHHTHSGEPDAEADHHHSHPHEHEHGHGHEHGHKHGHEHRHKHDDEHAHENSSPATAGLHAHHAHEHGRSLKQIRHLISHAPISPAAKATALAIFEALGRVEAGIHQVPVEDIHFHEVGSADAIVDITCAAVGAEALGVQEWVCSPINVGGGVVQCAHGTFPVPAPATLELLRACHAPVFASGVDKELATPTGAAIVSVLAGRFAPFPAMKIDRIGYGAGYRDLPGHANVLRLTVGEIDTTGQQSGETVTVIEANLDDISPQVIGYVFDRALAEGALDVFTVPLQMKKSRPGMLLTVLSQPQDADRLAELLFAETTTLGVRMRQESRQCLDRKHVSVSTPWGEIRLKLGVREGKITNFSPEYEDCRRAAAEHKVPLKSVMQEAIRLYMEKHRHE